MTHKTDTHHDINANTIFGFWVYLMTDFILFGTLFAAYAVLRNNTFGGPSGKELFELSQVFVQTIALLVSSLTCGMASLAIARENKNHVIAWFSLTFLLGVVFLAILCADFSHLIQEGYSWKTSAFLSAYFTLIGTHGLHILFGLVFMLLFLWQVMKWGLIPITIRRLNCLKIFWFFSYIVWIYMFTFVYLMGAK